MIDFVLISLILFLPTQLGLHFWPSWSFVNGLRIDYLSPTLYFTDLLLITLFLLNYYHFFLFLKRNPQISVLFFLFATFNTLISLIPQNTFIFWLRLLLLTNFSFIISSLSLSKLKKLFLPFCFSIMLISLIGLFQFFSQSSLGGPLYYLGERNFSLTTPDIARFTWGGSLFLRTYSLFSHPNAFAGFLVVSSLLLLSLSHLFAFKNKSWLKITFILSFFVLPFTFSRSAIFALIVSLPLLFVSVRRSPFILLSPLLALLLTCSFVLTPFSSDSSFSRRFILASNSLSLFIQYPLGVGLNNFIPALSKLYSITDYHLLQPVHNFFLLLLTELGLFFPMLLLPFKKKLPSSLFLPALSAFLITASLDHYWLTLPQNKLLLFFLLGLIFNHSLVTSSSKR